MKKITLCLFVICLMVSLVAQTVEIPQITFFGKASIGLYGNNDKTKDPVSMIMYPNSRIGWNVNYGPNCSYNAELAVSPTGVSIRALGGIIKKNHITYKVAHGLVPGFQTGSDGSINKDFTCDSFSEPGAAFIGRSPQISITMDKSENTLTLSLLPGIKVKPNTTEVTKSIPRIILTSKVKIINGIYCSPALGYGNYWDSDNTYHAYAFSLMTEYKVNKIQITGQGFVGNNFSDLGGLTIAKSGASSTDKNVQIAGCWVQGKYNGFCLGSGYTKNDHNNGGTIFLQYDKTLLQQGKVIISATPEFGAFFGDYVAKDIYYAGIRFTGKY